MQVIARVKELVAEKIADREDLFLVDASMQPGGKLIILLDGDNGVSIQDCVAVSRHVGFHLEEEDLIADAYNLEVSSPGVDIPLVSVRQYRKNIGRSLQIKLIEGTEKEGKLLDVSEEAITVEEKIKEKGKKAVSQQTEIPFTQIISSKVLISFK